MKLCLRNFGLRIFAGLSCCLPVCCSHWAGAQMTEPAAGKIELAEQVQLEQLDGVLRSQWERAQTLAAEKQWEEALDVLARLTEAPKDKLVGVGGGRYVPLRTWCQGYLARLPPDMLRAYRRRIDPLAEKWFQQGLANHDEQLLEDVAEQALASSYGDKALLALGEMALEAGDFTSARWYWERILPAHLSDPPLENGKGRQNVACWPSCPDSQLDPAAILARLVLVSILEGDRERATAELAQFAQLHPHAQGRLGDRQGRYVQLLEGLWAASASWAEQKPPPAWPTFAGSPTRNPKARPINDIGKVIWRTPLPTLPAGRLLGCPFFPVITDGLVFVNDSENILCVGANDGQPAWANTAAIFRSDAWPRAAAESLLQSAFGEPRYTLTVYRDRLFARLGCPLTERPAEAAHLPPSYLVALDLQAEGRLLWKVDAEAGWAFEGSPLCDGHGVYAAMRRQAIQPQAFVACFDADDGRPLWRRYICSAESPGRNTLPLCSHNLLTLNRRVLYYNTNLGAVAAISTEDGYLRWLTLYPRAREVDFYRLAGHWQRDPSPCLLYRGKLFVAPADSPRLLAFDAADGRLLWQSGSQLENVRELLAATERWLLAAGDKLYWISLQDADFGRVKHIWPEGEPLPACGRGLVAGRHLLWPARDKLYFFDVETAQPVKVFDLALRGGRSGNLLPAGNRLLLTTDTEMIALEAFLGDTPKSR